MDNLKRCKAYLQRIYSISGQGGDKAAFKACQVGVKFKISKENFIPLIDNWNLTNCQPPWEFEDLLKKINRAYEANIFCNDLNNVNSIYPDQAELNKFWNSCTSIFRKDALSFFKRRKLDPYKLNKLIRYNSISTHNFDWTSYKKQNGVLIPWFRTGWKLVIPCFDTHGNLISVRSRWILEKETKIKEIAPRGFKAHNLFFANENAQRILHYVHSAQFQKKKLDANHTKAHTESAGVLWICEGCPDFLTLCCARPQDAVIGIWNASWSSKLVKALNEYAKLFGLKVIIATHGDSEGISYKRKILSHSYAPEIKFGEYPLSHDDINDLWCKNFFTVKSIKRIR